MVRVAINEFKKNVKGCESAFSKLEKSLDTFTDNFGDYYETF